GTVAIGFQSSKRHSGWRVPPRSTQPLPPLYRNVWGRNSRVPDPLVKPLLTVWPFRSREPRRLLGAPGGRRGRGTTDAPAALPVRSAGCLPRLAPPTSAAHATPPRAWWHRPARAL